MDAKNTNAYELVSPETERQWRAYHEIRRTVLFEDRGRFGVYDENHPDDRLEEHHAKLLMHQGEAMGVIRVDITSDEAIFRRVAIRSDLQRRGHGRELLALAEEFSRVHDCRRLRSHVAQDAVGFYLKCGFSFEGDALPGEPVVMTKPIPAATLVGHQ